MKEIYKIKFAVFYGAMILSAMYLAYFLFGVVFAIAFNGFNVGFIINVNLVAVILFLYFYQNSNKYKNLYLNEKE